MKRVGLLAPRNMNHTWLPGCAAKIFDRRVGVQTVALRCIDLSH